MTEETTDLPGSMIMRCSRCHSTDVRRDGIACWNPSRQQWELIDVLDDGWCEECGAEGRRVIEEHAATGQQLPGTPPIESIVTAMERAALAYLAGMDPNARRALLNNGMAVTIAQVEAQARAEAEAERQQQRRASAQKLACPSGYDLTARQDGSMTCRLVEIDQTPRQVAPPMPPAGASCPAGSRWDGKGCWMPRQ